MCDGWSLARNLAGDNLPVWTVRQSDSTSGTVCYIGNGGKTINDIIDRFEVQIDIKEDGFVSVSGIDIEKDNYHTKDYVYYKSFLLIE